MFPDELGPTLTAPVCTVTLPDAEEASPVVTPMSPETPWLVGDGVVRVMAPLLDDVDERGLPDAMVTFPPVAPVACAVPPDRITSPPFPNPVFEPWPCPPVMTT